MPTSVSEQICKIRKERGLTQKQLGRLAGCSQTTVSDIEAGYFPAHSRWPATLLAALKGAAATIFLARKAV